MKISSNKTKLILSLLLIMAGHYAVAAPNNTTTSQDSIFSTTPTSNQDLNISYNFSDIGQSQIQCNIKTTISDGKFSWIFAPSFLIKLNPGKSVFIAQDLLQQHCDKSNNCVLAISYTNCQDLAGQHHYADNSPIFPLHRSSPKSPYQYKHSYNLPTIDFMGS